MITCPFCRKDFEIDSPVGFAAYIDHERFLWQTDSSDKEVEDVNDEEEPLHIQMGVANRMEATNDPRYFYLFCDCGYKVLKESYQLKQYAQKACGEI